ncbi:MAG: LysM peptidoglycan-binding domain-containing protein [Limnochordia bacterium]
MGQEWLKKDFDFDKVMENVDNFLGKLTYGFDRIESIVMEALGLWLKFDQFRSALRDLFSVGPRAAEVAVQQAGRVPASCPPGFQGRYTVRAGDTMFLIAQRFGVSLNALIAANPHISNPAVIFPGDVLCVPGAAGECGNRSPASCPAGFQGRYTVRAGDTMFLIAQRFGVSLNALIAANPHISNPNVICPGDVLCVPGAPDACGSRVPASCPAGFQGRYTVRAGDTMFLIAQRFGVSLNALIAANPHISNPNVICPGDVLCVPGAPGACGSRSPASCPPGFQGRYTVRAGDTMFLIAQRFGVSLNALIAANPHISNPNVICPGDVLCVPGAAAQSLGDDEEALMASRVPASCPPGFQGRYTVQPGDTMFLIAQRFGVSLNALIAANPHISNPNLIFPGDVLCVPGAPW